MFPPNTAQCPQHGWYYGTCVPCRELAVQLVFCDKCGCTYANKEGACPTHGAPAKEKT